MGNSNLPSRQARGFAYLWTLMLIAFMGVSLTIGSHLYETSVRRDKERELLFIGHEFRQAIGRYYEAGQQQYPSNLEDLLKDPRQPGIARYLRKIYLDPMTGKADWGLIKVNGKIAGVYSQSKQVPIKQGNFPPGESGLVGKGHYADWVFAYPLTLAFVKPGEDEGIDAPKDGGQPGSGGKDAGKGDSGKPDTGKGAPGKDDTGKTDAGKGDPGKGDPGKADPGKNGADIKK
jgi:type II secretory pathway pseudopilin PulG